MTSVNDLLTTGGAVAKFANPGDTISGVITSSEIRQAIDYQTDEPATWDDGSPKNQVIISLATDESDNDEDDGRRRVFIKAWGGQMKALRQAMRNAKTNDLADGGTFTATYTGEGPATVGRNGKRLNPPKVFAYTYTAPAKSTYVAKAAPTRPDSDDDFLEV